MLRQLYEEIRYFKTTRALVLGRCHKTYYKGSFKVGNQLMFDMGLRPEKKQRETRKFKHDQFFIEHRAWIHILKLRHQIMRAVSIYKLRKCWVFVLIFLMLDMSQTFSMVFCNIAKFRQIRAKGKKYVVESIFEKTCSDDPFSTF